MIAVSDWCFIKLSGPSNNKSSLVVTASTPKWVQITDFSDGLSIVYKYVQIAINKLHLLKSKIYRLNKYRRVKEATILSKISINAIPCLRHSVLPSMYQCYKKLTKMYLTKTNQSTQTQCKTFTQGVQAIIHWIWVNAKCKYVILMSLYIKEKHSNYSKKLWPETNKGNNDNPRILCTQAKYRMTNKKIMDIIQ